MTKQLNDDQKLMLSDVLAGLSQPQKSLPSKYFYDEEGSRIFDEITRLPEYYPTRTEAEIMRRHGDEIVTALGEGVLLIEYGSGSSSKTRILLSRLRNMAGYVPVDISGDYLLSVAAELRRDFPAVPVLPVSADFTQPFLLSDISTDVRHRVVYFPGSTIGNFTRPDAVRILRQMAESCGSGGGVLIGVDLLKPLDVLLPAYNDSQGVTARFNLNLLRRINRELGADFDLRQFDHRAIFNEAESRIEMFLVARSRTSACVHGNKFEFRPGESILTEYSHKYSAESFDQMADEAGLDIACVWTDVAGLFSVRYLTNRAG
jgi:dimethylhistidine N-methyltransferase